MAVPYLRQLVVGFPQRRPGLESRSRHVGFVADKLALGQVFSEYFGFSCQLSFHRLLHIHHHLSSGAGTVGQLVGDVPSGISLTPPQETKRKLSTSIMILIFDNILYSECLRSAVKGMKQAAGRVENVGYNDQSNPQCPLCFKAECRNEERRRVYGAKRTSPAGRPIKCERSIAFSRSFVCILSLSIPSRA
jgi:hypothetical protein